MVLFPYSICFCRRAKTPSSVSILLSFFICCHRLHMSCCSWSEFDEQFRFEQYVVDVSILDDVWQESTDVTDARRWYCTPWSPITSSRSVICAACVDFEELSLSLDISEICPESIECELQCRPVCDRMDCATVSSLKMVDIEFDRLCQNNYTPLSWTNMKTPIEQMQNLTILSFSKSSIWLYHDFGFGFGFVCVSLCKQFFTAAA